jgi:hypothetical protein
MRKDYQNREGEYEKSYSGSSYNKDERSHFAGRKEEAAPPKARKEEPAPPKARKEEPTPPKARKEEPAPRKDAGSASEEPLDQQTTQKMKRAKTIYKKLFMAWLFLFLLSNVFTCIMDDDSLDEDVQSEETMDDPWGWEDEEMEEDDQTSIDDDDNETNPSPA